MTAADVIVVLGLLFMLFWGIPRVFRSMSEDRHWGEQLRAFADRHGLRETKADDAHRREMPTLADIRRTRRNPALQYPPPGTAVFEGSLEDKPFALEQVFVKGRFDDRFFTFVRMAVTLEDAPPSLEVSPVRGLQRLWRKLRGDDSRLSIRHARAPNARAREEAFLTGTRRRLLEQAWEPHGGVWLARGNLYLIRERRGRETIDLDAMIEQLRTLLRQF